jgi:hypothetical protein
MLLALNNLFKVAAFIIAALVLFPSEASSNPEMNKLEPIWEKINGEWKFNDLNKQKHHSLVYVITTTDNKSNKNILTKEMVKLPFIQIIEEGKKEEISLH